MPNPNTAALIMQSIITMQNAYIQHQIQVAGLTEEQAAAECDQLSAEEHSLVQNELARINAKQQS